MHRIDNSTAVAALPAPLPVGTPGFFTRGNDPTGLAATRVDDNWLNTVQEEIANVVLAAGLQLSKVSNTQLYEAIQAIAYGANPDLSAYLPLSGGMLANPGNLVVAGTLTAQGNAQVVGTLTTGSADFYNPGYSNPVRILADPNQFALIEYHVLNTRDWAIGVENTGNFHIADIGNKMVMRINPNTGTQFSDNVEAHGAYFISPFGTPMGTAQFGLTVITGEDSLHIQRVNPNGSLLAGIARFDYGPGIYNLVALGGAYKPQGGEWANLDADARLKKDVAPYEQGLAAVRRLNPVSYRCNGLGDTRDDGRTYHGLVAQDTLEIMPEMVAQMPVKLHAEDQEKTPVYTMDCTALSYALVNAVRELADRVEVLERRPAPLPA